MDFEKEVNTIKSLVARPEFKDSKATHGVFVDSIRQKLLPNELAYVVDCRTGEVDNIQQPKLKNFFEIKDSSGLYNHIHPSYIDDTLKYTQKLVSVYNSIENYHTDTVATAYYKSEKGDVIQKTTFSPMTENGRIRFTAGILRNLYSDVDISRLSYRYVGPSSDLMYNGINKEENQTSLLSGREIQILKLLAQGKKSKLIGHLLSISENTVRTHRRNIIAKLGVSGTIQALRKAEEKGIIL